jgi:thymidine phosphorylase
MAKIYAGGTKYCLIDLPVGKNWKIPDRKTAKRIAWHFEYIWKKLGMKINVDITNADHPVGRWIGAVLQTREALRILQNKKNISKDIKKKAISLSAQLIQLVWLAKWDKAVKLAEKQLKSGNAWEYMQKLIQSQNKIHNVKPDYKNTSYLWVLDSEELPLAKFSDKLIATKSGKIKGMDVELLKKICRIFWAPLDKQVWFYLSKHVWELVKKWDILCELYANDEDDLERGIKILDQKELYLIC